MIPTESEKIPQWIIFAGSIGTWFIKKTLMSSIYYNEYTENARFETIQYDYRR